MGDCPTEPLRPATPPRIPRRLGDQRHSQAALLRQTIISRLAGYEDLNEAAPLRFDPIMRAVFGGRARDPPAASTCEVARFESEMLTTRADLDRLMDLSGRWVGRDPRHLMLNP